MEAIMAEHYVEKVTKSQRSKGEIHPHFDGHLCPEYRV